MSGTYVQREASSGFFTALPYRDLGSNKIQAIQKMGAGVEESASIFFGGVLVDGGAGKSTKLMQAPSSGAASVIKEATRLARLYGSSTVSVPLCKVGDSVVWKRVEEYSSVGEMEAILILANDHDDIRGLVEFGEMTYIQKAAAKLNPMTPVGYTSFVGRLKTRLSKTTGPMDSSNLNAALDELLGEGTDWIGDKKKTKAVLRAVKDAAPSDYIMDEQLPKYETVLTATGEEITDGVKRDLVYEQGVSMGLDFTLADEKAIAAVAATHTNFVRNSFGARNAQMSIKARSIVSQGLEEGLGRGEIAGLLRKDLKNSYEKNTKNYMDVVAASFVGRARSKSCMTSYQEAQIEVVEVLAVLDDATSDICRFMDGKVLSVKETIRITEAADGLSNPADVKTALPWMRSNKNGLSVPTAGGGSLQVASKGDDGVLKGKIDDGKYADAKIGFPPYHGLCRTTTIASSDLTASVQVPAEAPVSDKEIKPESVLSGKPIKAKPKEEDVDTGSNLDIDVFTPATDFNSALKRTKELGVDIGMYGKDASLDVMNEINGGLVEARNMFGSSQISGLKVYSDSSTPRGGLVLPEPSSAVGQELSLKNINSRIKSSNNKNVVLVSGAGSARLSKSETIKDEIIRQVAVRHAMEITPKERKEFGAIANSLTPQQAYQLGARTSRYMETKQSNHLADVFGDMMLHSAQATRQGKNQPQYMVKNKAALDTLLTSIKNKKLQPKSKPVPVPKPVSMPKAGTKNATNEKIRSKREEDKPSIADVQEGRNKVSDRMKEPEWTKHFDDAFSAASKEIGRDVLDSKTDMSDLSYAKQVKIREIITKKVFSKMSDKERGGMTPDDLMSTMVSVTRSWTSSSNRGGAAMLKVWGESRFGTGTCFHSEYMDDDKGKRDGAMSYGLKDMAIRMTQKPAITAKNKANNKGWKSIAGNSSELKKRAIAVGDTQYWMTQKLLRGEGVKGKPLYRGVSGDMVAVHKEETAKHRRESPQPKHEPNGFTNTRENPVASWTTDPTTAAQFALENGPKRESGRIMVKYIDSKDTLYSDRVLDMMGGSSAEREWVTLARNHERSFMSERVDLDYHSEEEYKEIEDKIGKYETIGGAKSEKEMFRLMVKSGFANQEEVDEEFDNAK